MGDVLGALATAVEKGDKVVDVVKVVKVIKFVLDSVVPEVLVDGRAIEELSETSFLALIRSFLAIIALKISKFINIIFIEWREEVEFGQK